MSEPSSVPYPSPSAIPSPSDTARSLRQEPGRVVIHLPRPESLFDHRADPAYPHTGPMVERSVAKFLVDATREQRAKRDIEMVIVSDSAPLTSTDEEDVRNQLHRYFADEAELVSLDQRINRTEGLGSLRYSIPLIAVALLVAGLFYAQIGGSSGVAYLEALTYLVFITIVWVMLWDPLEMLLFDSYIIRLHVRALNKLARACVTFTYRPSPASAQPDEAQAG